MKNILKLTFGLLVMSLLFSACEDPDDFMTSDAKTGGLVNPTGLIPFKLGITPTFNIDIDVPKGEPIETIHVKYYYMRMSDTTMSNELTFDIAVNGANKDEAVLKSLPYTWDALRAGIVLPTDPQIPATDLDPTIAGFIGDYWLFSYTITMEDGREIINNQTTQVAIANFFAGTYDVVMYYWHPTAGGDYPPSETGTPYAGIRNMKKDLTPTSPYDCNTYFAVWTANYTNINIDADNNVTITFDRADAISGDPSDPTRLNTYDPETGIIQIYYYYPGAGGNRIFWEKFVPKN